MLKKVYLSLFVATLLFSFNFASIANAANLTYWYNVEDDTIGYDPVRYIYRYNYDGFTNDESLNYANYAKQQWYDNGNGPYSYLVSSINDASIKLYTGSYDTLVEYEPALYYKAASTHVIGVLDGYHYYNGVKKYNYRITGSTIYIPKRTLKTDSYYKFTFTHELGHAFGWLGHSGTKSHVMYETYSVLSSPVTLTSADKNHLFQNY